MGEAARGDKMHSGMKCVWGGVGCGNKMITELQKKWETVQDQIHIFEKPSAGPKD